MIDPDVTVQGKHESEMTHKKIFSNYGPQDIACIFVKKKVSRVKTCSCAVIPFCMWIHHPSNLAYDKEGLGASG